MRSKWGNVRHSTKARACLGAGRRAVSRFTWLTAASLLLGLPAGAQEEQRPQYELQLLDFRLSEIRTRLWELELGMPIAELPRQYLDPHCGTNGGPPSIRLDNWGEFARCPADTATGLHEVWYTEDDEVEYIARSFRQMTFDPGPASANVLFNHKVIYSILIDDDGLIQGYRIFTDNRESPDVRLGAYFIATPLINLYGYQAFECVDRPPAEGEAPMDGVYVNALCTGVVGDLHVTIESHLFRKPGQTAFDPIGRENIGYFESTARLEAVNVALVPE
jgi:hypothetical protein